MNRVCLAALLILTLGSAPKPGEAASITCLEAPYRSAEAAGQEALVALAAMLRAALEDFPALLAVFESRRPFLCHSASMIEAKAFYEPESNRIVVAAGMEPGLSLAVLVHETRHLHQFQYGICPSGSLAMREYARAVFAMEADANVVSLLVAWSLRSSGDPRMWRALADWPMTGDIAARFAETMTAQSDIVAAAAAAFDQWYASDLRRETYYVAACSDYLDQSDRTHALPAYQALPADFLTRLCHMPDGSPYPCAEAGDPFER